MILRDARRFVKMAVAFPVMENVERRVARNVAEIRAQRGLTQKDLSDRLAAMGHKILLSGISKIEKGERRVDVQDLVALALALGVNPNRLLMPERADSEEVELTPKVKPAAFQAWAWAEGDQPLLAAAYGGPHAEWREAMYDFMHHSRPVDKRARETSGPMNAARALIARIDELLTYLIETGQGELHWAAVDGSESHPITGGKPVRRNEISSFLTKMNTDPIVALVRAKERLIAEVEDLVRAAQRSAPPWPPADRDPSSLPDRDAPLSTPGAQLAAEAMAQIAQKFAETGKMPGDSDDENDPEGGESGER